MSTLLAPAVDDTTRALIDLLDEPSGCATARTRLSQPFDRLVAAAGAPGPVLLFGCGPLGRHTAARLQAAGLPPVAFVDNAAKACGSSVLGVTVLSPSEAVARYGETGLFVVTIYNGAAVRGQLEALGCRRVLHFASFYFGLPDLFLPYYRIDRPDAVFAARDEIVAVNESWADDASRAVFAQRVGSALGHGGADTFGAAADCYVDPGLFVLDGHDRVIDCGAFDGDTIRQLLAAPRIAPGRIDALEPDPSSACALRAFVDGLDGPLRERIHVHESAASDDDGRLAFDAVGTVAARAGSGRQSVAAVRIDTLAVDVVPTYVKMDIEGHELDALRGAVVTMRRHAPILAISLYHRADDLWRIPAFIRGVNPSYRLFLRCYAEDGWESVCYAVPVSRLQDKSHRRLP